jgi:hypothetical protein
MSRLHLTVDGVDNAAAYGIDPHKVKKTDTSMSENPSMVNKKRVLRGPTVWVGGTGYTEAKVASILRDFLQPDSKTTLQSAAQSLLVLIPSNASSNAEVRSFGDICVELAEQIPYDHPSQLKLVGLLQYLSTSPKFLDRHLPNVW